LSAKEFSDAEVEAVFNAYDEEVRGKLLDLRNIIFETAAKTPGVGELEETLKWGQPSYLTPVTKSGTTVRIDKVKSSPGTYAMYFHCQTSLIETFRQIYPDDLIYQGNRGIVFKTTVNIPEATLRHCISLALTYHLQKKRK